MVAEGSVGISRHRGASFRNHGNLKGYLGPLRIRSRAEGNYWALEPVNTTVNRMTYKLRGDDTGDVLPRY
jgi:hypothetical protein